jgi:hypothetical protein
VKEGQKGTKKSKSPDVRCDTLCVVNSPHNRTCGARAVPCDIHDFIICLTNILTSDSDQGMSGEHFVVFVICEVRLDTSGDSHKKKNWKPPRS